MMDKQTLRQVSLGGVQVGDLWFYADQPPYPDGTGDLSFIGQIPESFIPNFLGRHPEALIAGFTAAPKPPGCEWMSDSRITAIENYEGLVMIGLKAAKGEK